MKYIKIDERTDVGKPYVGRILINGIFKESISEKREDTISPSHAKVVGNYPLCDDRDVDEAVEAASASFRAGDWTSLTGRERASVLLKVAEMIEQNLEPIAKQEVLESGKPITQARGEVAACADLWRYAASLARDLHGESYNTLGDDVLGVVVRQPVGVVAIITPWNFPLLILSQKLPFALAAGCSVVVKPSELTSGTSLMIAEFLVDAGLPAGIINMLTGYGKSVGYPLINHPEVDFVSFTGSTAVGRQLAEIAGRNLKKISLELGGKNPQIIMPDCDWDAAVDAVVFGVYFNAGECCNSGSRILVHKDIAEEFVNAVIEKTAEVKIGDPFDPDVLVGSLIHQRHQDNILKSIEAAENEGAMVRIGGRTLDGKGYFLEPTVISGVKPDMRMASEEVFGPVLAVVEFSDIKEAINIANSTQYGLSAAIWSNDIHNCLMASKKLEAGTVWVNTFLEGYSELPFGGFKDSGIGRELGRYSVDEYTEKKTIQLKIGGRQDRWVMP